MRRGSHVLAPNAPHKKWGRSSVTNGNDVLPGVDGRSEGGRRFRDLVIQICEDQGGLDRLSESRLQLVRRFCAACVLAEAMEAKLVNGEQISVQEHALLCSSLVRIASRIGINRVPKNVTPELRDYIETEQKEIEIEPA